FYAAVSIPMFVRALHDALPIWRLLETWPENTLAADATFAIARTLAELGRYDEAVPFLAAFTTRYPRHEHAADARYLLKLTTAQRDRKSTRLNSSHEWISYALFR